MSSIFARTELLIGREGLKKLQSSGVAVLGLGGVGSFAAEALARAGLGYLLLVDHDVVDQTNINRQLPALIDTVGQAKTALMAKRLGSVNPALLLETCQEKFTPHRASAILDRRQIDFVVDAIDDVENKVALIEACVQRKLPLISAMGAGDRLDPTCFKVDSIWNTSVCPLARIIRRKLRAADINQDIPVVYSDAKPMPRYDDGADAGIAQRFVGSISFVPPVVGCYLAGFVVNSILDQTSFYGD